MNALNKGRIFDMMKARLFLVFTLFSWAFHLQAQSFKKEAIEFNDKAVKILHGDGSLSSRIALANSLLDSAILLDHEYATHFSLLESFASFMLFEIHSCHGNSKIIEKEKANDHQDLSFEVLEVSET